jgi:hypothetical protein
MCFEVLSQMMLVYRFGNIGVPASIMAALMVVISISLNIPWLLVSQSVETRQIHSFMVELAIDLLYVTISLLAFYLYIGDFKYERGGDCYSERHEGFGAFSYGCFDIGDRQRTVYAFKSLISESLPSLYSNMTPILGLAFGLNHLLKIIAARGRQQIPDTIGNLADAKQHRLPKKVAVFTSLVSVILLAYGLGSLFVNERNCEGIDSCTQIAHPVFDFGEGCACATFVATTCDSSTGEHLILSAERGYLHTIVVGNTGILEYQWSSSCKVLTDNPDQWYQMPWESLGQIEVVVLVGISNLKEPVKVASDKLLVLSVAGMDWRVLPGLSSSLMYLEVYHAHELVDVGDWTRLTELTVVKVWESGMNPAPDLSQCLKLEVINFNNNFITALPDLSKHKHLRNLYFDKNLVEILPPLPQSLRKLSGIENQLVDISSLQDLPNLEEVILLNNFITTKPFPGGVPQGILLAMVGNPICDICGPDDCGICEPQCHLGCGFDLLIGNQMCDDACNVPSCGFDQGFCGDPSQLPCTESCYNSMVVFFLTKDQNKDGVISGEGELYSLTDMYNHPAMESPDAHVTLGVANWAASQVGGAPPDSNCWGCDWSDVSGGITADLPAGHYHQMSPDGCFDAVPAQPDLCGWSNKGVANGSLKDCQDACLQRPTCIGIQHANGNCDFITGSCDYEEMFRGSGGNWRIQSKACFDDP